jgi:hypothetical protein
MRRVAGDSAALAAADFHLADHAARRIEQTRMSQRPDRERRGRRVAADAAHITGGRNLRSIELGQAIHESIEPRLAGVCRPIPPRVVVGLSQTEVSAQIDDAIGEFRKPIDLADGAAVLQAQKHQIDVLSASARTNRRRAAPQVGVVNERTACRDARW